MLILQAVHTIAMPLLLLLSQVKIPVMLIVVPRTIVQAVHQPIVALSMTEQVPANLVTWTQDTLIVPLAPILGPGHRHHSDPWLQLSECPIIVDGAPLTMAKIATIEHITNEKCRVSRVDSWINRDHHLSCLAAEADDLEIAMA